MFSSFFLVVSKCLVEMMRNNDYSNLKYEKKKKTLLSGRLRRKDKPFKKAYSKPELLISNCYCPILGRWGRTNPPTNRTSKQNS